MMKIKVWLAGGRRWDLKKMNVFQLHVYCGKSSTELKISVRDG